MTVVDGSVNATLLYKSLRYVVQVIISKQKITEIAHDDACNFSVLKLEKVDNCFT